MVGGKISDVTTETVIDFEHDETHAHGIDHLLGYQSTISHHFLSRTELSLFFPLFLTA